MQVRGFAYFEDREFEDVISKKNIFEKEFPDCEKGYFSSLYWDVCCKKEILLPGIFILGEVNKDKDSTSVVGSLRNIMGLKSKIRNCDVSVRSEDCFVGEGGGGRKLKEFYLGIRIKNPVSFSSVHDFAFQVRQNLAADDVLVRGVEKDKKSMLPILCVEVFTQISLCLKVEKRKITNLIKEKGLEGRGFTFIKFPNI